MSGTVSGGRKAAATNLARNPNFYRDIGRKGGSISRGGGFAGRPDAARKAGATGGSRSRRGFKLLEVLEDGTLVYVNNTTNEIRIVKTAHEENKEK